MVRTYAFNPSTQHSATLPGARERDRNKSLSSSQPSMNTPSTFLQEIQNSPLDSSFSSTHSSVSPSIVEGSLTVLGIRTVLIDGQTYYQPIEPELQRLLNQQLSNMGFSQASATAAPQDPAPKHHQDAHSKAMLAALHIASQMNGFDGKAMAVAYGAGPRKNGRIMEKSFSEQKDVESLPNLNPGQAMLSSIQGGLPASVRLKVKLSCPISTALRPPSLSPFISPPTCSWICKRGINPPSSCLG